MNNAILYILTVLIWGTAWYAIKLQVGYAPPELSILYRATLAAICLTIWCKIKGFNLRFSAKDHLFLCMLGMSMFSLHYLFGYNATRYTVSGTLAVVFSATSFLSILYNYLFFKIKPSLNIVLGALIGISGLCIFFWHELKQVSLQDSTVKGLMLAGTSAVIFSLGGSISKRNHKHGIPIIPAMTIGMWYAILVLLIYNFSHLHHHFFFPKSLIYWGSLMYLVIPGSIISFLCYLQLIKNIGQELAGYMSVLSPIVALFVSAGFEGYTWSIVHLIGLSLVVVGNILVISKR
jgi:drug/metabolite transporter (DMT)-like permease